MVKKRQGTPWKPAGEYSKELVGLTINLLVKNIARSTDFASTVLGAHIVYQDEDFAAVELNGSKWCLHCDHTYQDHPLSGSLTETSVRGIGAEFRVLALDPDEAESRARTHGHTVLAGAMDKAHGMREAYIIDPDGYCWVPSVVI